MKNYGRDTPRILHSDCCIRVDIKKSSSRTFNKTVWWLGNDVNRAFLDFCSFRSNEFFSLGHFSDLRSSDFQIKPIVPPVLLRKRLLVFLTAVENRKGGEWKIIILSKITNPKKKNNTKSFKAHHTDSRWTIIFFYIVLSYL